jgi:hypothetical protein
VRFRLDPKEADVPVELPPRAPSAPAAPPPAAPRAPSAPASAASKRKLIVVALIGLLLVGGGAGAVLYATDTGPFAYPHAYLVEGSSVPSGMQLPSVPQDAQDQWGVTSNPGEVPKEHLAEIGDSSIRPTQAWVEVLSARGTPNALSVIAAKFPDADRASSFVATARVRCLAGGAAVLQDGDVVVLVIVGDSAAMPYYTKVKQTILGQVSGIRTVCG